MLSCSSELLLHDNTTSNANKGSSESGTNQTTQIMISFQALLLQITNYLHFPAPKYDFVDIQRNNAVVLVYTDSGPEAYTFVGGPSESLEKSCQRAAQLAVTDFMERFNVWVEDISISQRREFERCAGLYKLKRQELRNRSKGLVGAPLIERLTRGAPIGSEPVIVDYTAILSLILNKCDIENSNFQTILHGQSKYIAWITISCTKAVCGCKTFYSIYCDRVEDAKNSLAKKVIDYLIPLYNLEIIDANYNPSLTSYAALLCSLEMESYLASKERFLGLQIKTKTTRLLPLRRSYKSRDQGLVIPTMISDPVPPKKRSSYTSSMLMSVKRKMEIGQRTKFKVPDELPTVFKRARRSKPT